MRAACIRQGDIEKQEAKASRSVEPPLALLSRLISKQKTTVVAVNQD